MKERQPFLITKRLKLYPLTPDQMRLLIDAPGELYALFSLIPDDAPHSAAFQELAETQYCKMLADPEHMSFHTLWLITQLEGKHSIGYLYFTDAPSDTGMTELRGCIKNSYRQQDYMTEACDIMRSWAFSKRGVLMLLAHAEKEDVVLHGLLRKLHFSHWIERESSNGPEVWCCEKPPRSMLRVGMLLGIGCGSVIGLASGLGALLCGLIGLAIGIVLCALMDAKTNRERYRLLTAELAKPKASHAPCAAPQ